MNSKKNSGFFKGKEKWLVGISLLGLLFSALPLFSDSIYQKIFGSQNLVSQKEVVGEISFIKNDIRHKNSESYSWGKAKSAQAVQIGDSVFTGEKSKSQVRLRTGEQMDLDENSMVTFSKINDVNVPNLETGNFLVSVKGKMQIGIGGELTEIEGDGSQVQVVLTKKKKPFLRLVKGQAKIKSQGQSKQLVPMAVTTLAPKVNESLREPAKTEVAVIPPSVKPKLVEQVTRTDEFLDFYEIKEKSYRLRTLRKQLVSFPLPVAWDLSGEAKEVFGQLSGDPNFAVVADTFKKDPKVQAGYFRQGFLGDNFVRLSVNGNDWGKTEKIYLESLPLASPPKLLVKNSLLHILKDTVNVQVQIQLFGESTAAVVEVSNSANFPNDQTNVIWNTTKRISIPVQSAQVLYLRARGANSKYQVTKYSDIVKIQIDKPLPLLSPALADLKSEYETGELLEFKWDKVYRAKNFEVKIEDKSGRVIYKKRLVDTSFKLRAKGLGQFKIQVAAIDRFERRSASAKKFSVIQKPPPILAKQSEPARAPAQEATLTEKISPSVPSYLNKNYDSSKLSVQGSAFSMFSREQVSADKENPTAVLASVDWMKWFENWGTQATFKSKVADVSSQNAASASPLNLEARLHRRWHVGWSPFSSYNSSQISWFTGFEYYRNSNSGLFSPKYDLLKTGLNFEFPFMKRWDTGGEFVYGHGLDQSKKYEISGHLHYYLKTDWSLGVGYRLHLFEAGSTSSSPLGLPYREGFGEGYSVLRWHY